jgi:hypothetical protein
MIYISTACHQCHLQHWINNIVLAYSVLVQYHDNIDRKDAVLSEFEIYNVPNQFFLIAAIITGDFVVVSAGSWGRYDRNKNFNY